MTELQRYELQKEIAEIFNKGAATLHLEQFRELYIDSPSLAINLIISKSDKLADIRARAAQLYGIIRDGHLIEYFCPKTLLIYWSKLAPNSIIELDSK